MQPLIELAPEGLYCPPADVYIDPWRPVPRAILTHAHADHARFGCRYYLAHHQSRAALQLRLRAYRNLTTKGYGETFTIKGVQFSLHPAGHIPGSAQVRIEYRGEVWVISGDYKVEDDGLTTPFEPVRCHTFVTESTFGMPVYRWQSQAVVFAEINNWWATNQQEGKASVLTAYSLGKAQRLLCGVNSELGPIYVHGAIGNMNAALAADGYRLPRTLSVTPQMPKAAFRNSLILCPPSALGSPWIKRFQPFSTGMASGWMAVRGQRRRRAADRGFVLSDHADWPGLLQAVEATKAERVLVTHGYSAVLARYLTEQGLEARELETFFGAEEED